MKKLRVPYSSRVTLVIEHFDEIVWFSHAIQAMTLENLDYQQKLRKKHPDPEPLGYQLDEPTTFEGVDFYPGFPCEVILVDRYDNILSCWPEPDFSEDYGRRNFNGVKTLLFFPEGFIRESGLIQGVSKLTLRSSMAWAPIYCSEVWSKELKIMSDQEIIALYNSMACTGYMGNLGSSRRHTLGKEIQSRSFDYSVIFSPGSHGSIDFISFEKKVRLAENRLEVE